MIIVGTMTCPMMVSIVAMMRMVWSEPMFMVVRCHAALIGMTSGVICMSVSAMIYPNAMRVICSIIMLVHSLVK